MIYACDAGDRNRIEHGMPLEFKSVKSSNIDAVAHSPESSELHVRFKNGGVYKYAGVDADKHKALMAADSVGSYIHKNIKGVHAHTKVDP
jgi:KTSC domain